MAPIVAESATWFVNARVDGSADSSGLRLLRDSVAALKDTRTCEPDWLRTALFNMADAPWGSWGKNGGGITTFAMKQWLKDYGIKPYSVKVGGEVVRATTSSSSRTNSRAIRSLRLRGMVTLVTLLITKAMR